MGNNIAQGLYPLQRHHHHHHPPHHHRQHHHHRADDDGAASGAWAVIIMKHTTTLDCSTLRPKKRGVCNPQAKCRAHKAPIHPLSLSLADSVSLQLTLSAVLPPRSLSLSLPCRSSQKRSSTNFHFFARERRKSKKGGRMGRRHAAFHL